MSVTSKGIVVLELIEANAICPLNWAAEGNGNLQERKRHGRGEKKRLIRNREEEKEVKLMFGQMKKDGWDLMEWVKEAEEAAQLGLIRHSSLLFLLFIPLFSFPHSFILPSIKALIGSGYFSANPNPEISFVRVQLQINPD